jgi:DNA-binding NtrC family response regulator
LERAVILAGEGSLYPAHFSFTQLRVPADSEGNHLDVRVGFTIDEAERSLIEATLKQTGDNKTKAAAILGISTKTLHVKLKQYRLASDEAMAAADAGA